MTTATPPSAPVTAPAQPDGPRPPLDDNDATAFGDLVRFRAQDGIFLRAEHLAVMQDYTAQLTRAVGLASGTGVVYGFRATLTADDVPAVVVEPGLAIDPFGRPLHTTAAAKIAVKDAPPVPDGNGFWVLEIRRQDLPFGTEPVFGNPCSDPCSGSTLTPWLAEGIIARLRPRPQPGFINVDGDDRRSFVASTYFEFERTLGGPFLVPGGESKPVDERDWTDVMREPPKDPWLPLAVVWLDGAKKPQLDMWTARREVYGRLADNLWRTRLATRPWNVFLAQVLQFQDQLVNLPSTALDPQEARGFGEIWEPVESFVKAMADTPVRNWNDYKQFMVAFEQTAGKRAALTAGKPLHESGIAELPPAGLLPMAEGDNWEEVIRGWLDGADVRFVDCRADHVPGAIERARDLDRIPLKSTRRPQVDVLVPQLRADLPPLDVDPVVYGWVAFVRRDEVAPVVKPPPVDRVAVYYDEGDLGSALATAEKETPRGERIEPDLEYPENTWEYPGGETAEKVELVEGPIDVIAVAATDAGRPLAALRATLFAASLTPVKSEAVTQVHVVVRAGADPEAIVINQNPEKPPPPLDRVAVYYDKGDLGSALATAEKETPRGERIEPDLEYPENTWEYPGGETAEKVELVEGPIDVIAVAATDAGRPLAALRATLFAASLTPVKSEAVTQVHVVVRAGADPEAIVINQNPPPVIP